MRSVCDLFDRLGYPSARIVAAFGGRGPERFGGAGHASAQICASPWGECQSEHSADDPARDEPSRETGKWSTLTLPDCVRACLIDHVAMIRSAFPPALFITRQAEPG